MSLVFMALFLVLFGYLYMRNRDVYFNKKTQQIIALKAQ